ncbi:dystonin [Mytilus galloprovincialis]|uniref:Dystonin n=1 Tax=Mytilus galloprovincialis TaxID=29158 RepID=A0A8B6HIA7_MYTGA|nr:dystonin [Mytilus galloprovincialis]
MDDKDDGEMCFRSSCVIEIGKVNGLNVSLINTDSGGLDKNELIDKSQIDIENGNLDKTEIAENQQNNEKHFNTDKRDFVGSVPMSLENGTLNVKEEVNKMHSSVNHSCYGMGLTKVQLHENQSFDQDTCGLQTSSLDQNSTLLYYENEDNDNLVCNDVLNCDKSSFECSLKCDSCENHQQTDKKFNLKNEPVQVRGDNKEFRLGKGDNNVSGNEKGDNNVSGHEKGDNNVSGHEKGDNKVSGHEKGDNNVSGHEKGDDNVSGHEKGDFSSWMVGNETVEMKSVENETQCTLNVNELGNKNVKMKFASTETGNQDIPDTFEVLADICKELDDEILPVVLEKIEHLKKLEISGIKQCIVNVNENSHKNVTAEKQATKSWKFSIYKNNTVENKSLNNAKLSSVRYSTKGKITDLDPCPDIVISRKYRKFEHLEEDLPDLCVCPHQDKYAFSVKEFEKEAEAYRQRTHQLPPIREEHDNDVIDDEIESLEAKYRDISRECSKHLEKLSSIMKQKKAFDELSDKLSGVYPQIEKKVAQIDEQEVGKMPDRDTQDLAMLKDLKADLIGQERKLKELSQTGEKLVKGLEGINMQSKADTVRNTMDECREKHDSLQRDIALKEEVFDSAVSQQHDVMNRLDELTEWLSETEQFLNEGRAISLDKDKLLQHLKEQQLMNAEIDSNKALLERLSEAPDTSMTEDAETAIFDLSER